MPRLLPRTLAGFAAALALGAPAAGATAGADFRLSYRFELEGRYDDNITELSDRDKDRVGDPAYADRFRIESPGGFAWSPSARVQFTSFTATRVRTDIRVDARFNSYVSNTVKNYETFSAHLTQDLTASKTYNTRLLASVEYLPDFYLRELTVPGTTVFASDEYRSLDYGLGLEQTLVPKHLDLQLSVSREARTYDDPFNERDGDLTSYGVELEWHPGGHAVDLKAGYERGSYDAQGDDPSTSVLEPDISGNRSTVHAGVGFHWGSDLKEGTLTAGAVRETRDFTSSNPADIYHFDRHDTRPEFDLAIRQGLGANFYLEFDANHESNDAQLATGVPEATSRDVTDFTRNIVSLALGWNLRTHPGHRTTREP